jgi:hypothetical protein
MKRPFLVAALAVLAASNAFVLLQVAMNRRGTAEAELELTARELSRDDARGDDSRVSLVLRWQNTAPEYPAIQAGSPGWFDQQKLKQTGFDVNIPPDAKEAPRHYQNSRTREVFVALEFDGAAWQQWLQGHEAIEEPIEALRQTASHLVAVDAGLDPEVLRRKYPDRKRVMILRGLARAILESGGPSAYLRGAITQISNEAVNVPVPFSELLTFIPVSYATPGDSYAVTLRIGQRYEPWIADLKRLRP